MLVFLKELWAEETGAVSVEYVLIAFVIGLALIPLVSRTAGVATRLYTPLPGLFDAFPT